MRCSAAANQFQLEALEPRVLLSGDPLPVGAALGAVDSSAIAVSVADHSAAEPGQADSVFAGLEAQPLASNPQTKENDAATATKTVATNSPSGTTTAAPSSPSAQADAVQPVAASDSQSTADQLTETLRVANAPPAASASQVIWLNFEGAQNLTYRGPVTISGINLPAFSAPANLAGQEGGIISAVLTAFKRGVTRNDIVFTTTKPAAGTEYSTIFIGGDGSMFAPPGTFYGLSETDDTGNQNHCDNAFVFSSIIPIAADSATDYAEQLATYIAHEAGHLLGFEHLHTVHTGDASDVFADVAWHTFSHVEIAKDVRDDILQDGLLTIGGHQYTIHPKLVEAIKKYPSFYYAGAIGPDGFPDWFFGETVVHPADTGTWLQRIFDMAWASQTDSSFTDAEKLQNLAFAYGYATHAAGDAFGHTLINEFTQGVFPAFSQIATDERLLANAVRHFLVEAYLGDATPGFDGDFSRSLLPNGDISDVSSPGIPLDVPVRFLFEVMIRPFSGDPAASADTGLTTLGVDYATKSFTRTTGSFMRDIQPGDKLGDNFQIGDVIYTSGFAKNNTTYLASQPGQLAQFTVVDVTAHSLKVAETFVQGETTGPNRAIFTQGLRGRILNVFVALRAQLTTAIDKARTAYGNDPIRDFNTLFNILVAQLPTLPTARESEEMALAYLINWRNQLDSGLRNWGEFGLAVANGFYQDLARRQEQNTAGERTGNDSDPDRADIEDGIGILDSILGAMNDPNFDGNTNDSINTTLLLPMLGFPEQIIQLKVFIANATQFIADNVVGPVRLALNPVTAALADLKEIPKDFLKEFIKSRCGLDIDQIDFLLRLNNKMDVQSITHNGAVLPIFGPNDHEKLDAYMGIHGIEHSEELSGALEEGLSFGIVFYPDAKLELSGNVEFDKTKFAGYANSVVLAKLLLLREVPITGDTDTSSLGQLSLLMSNTLADLGTPLAYDWTKLIVNGDHGGDIMTTTLQHPDQPNDPSRFPGIPNNDPEGRLFIVTNHGNGSPDYPGEFIFRDQAPWLRLIDGISWREDSMMTSYSLFRIAAKDESPLPADEAKAVWTVSTIPGQSYLIQTTWLANVTQRIGSYVPGEPGHFIGPASNAKYKITNGAQTITFQVDQRGNPTQTEDTIEGVSLTFNTLGSITAQGSSIRIELSNKGVNGEVIAGPMRVQSISNPANIQRIYRVLDKNTLQLKAVQNGYSEEDPNHHWLDEFFPAGSGNFPLWESETLRPVFRTLFRDWVNGPVSSNSDPNNFPGMGDLASPDPNLFNIPKHYGIPPLVDPFDPLTTTTTTPPGLNLVITGSQTLNFKGTTVLSSVAGNGDATPDNLTLIVAPALTGNTTLTVDVATKRFLRSVGSFITDGFLAGQEIIASGFIINNGTFHITAVTATSLTVSETLFAGDSSGSGDEAIVSRGELIIAGLVGGGGLKDITLQAQDEIDVLPFSNDQNNLNDARISSRQVAAGNSVFDESKPSVANSGNITLTAPQILVGNGATIFASASSGFTAGNVTLTATATQNVNWSFGIGSATFRSFSSNALIELGLDTKITGRDIRLQTQATTTKTAVINTDLNPANPSGLEQQIEDSELIEFSGVAAAVFAESHAQILVHPGTQFIAAQDLFLDSDAVANAVITTKGKYLGITYGSSAPSAFVTVENGAILTAARNIEVKATAENILAVTTIVPNAGDVANFSVSYGKARSKSVAEIQSGVTVTAQNATIWAENTNSFTNVAIAAGFNASQSLGFGATLVLGSYFSSASAIVAGNVTLTGNLTVRSRSLDLQDESRAFADVQNSLGSNPVITALQNFLGSIDLSSVVDGVTIDPHITGPDVSLAAAIVLVETENKAIALIDEPAFLVIGGTVTVDSLAEEHFRASAAANASDSSAVGIGGAVAWSRIFNQATAFIGYNVIMDVTHGIQLTATATITNPVPVFQPSINLADTDTATGSARIAEEYSDANAIGVALKNALAPLAAFLAPNLADPNLIGTSFVDSGGSVPNVGSPGTELEFAL